ncbi:hypothetical protein XENTR_v10006826 [Xenopus tropicalis]|nr:hypothetical protein XENTR_v10006826 [Xenopus tropicalis]
MLTNGLLTVYEISVPFLDSVNPRDSDIQLRKIENEKGGHSLYTVNLQILPFDFFLLFLNTFTLIMTGILLFLLRFLLTLLSAYFFGRINAAILYAVSGLLVRWWHYHSTEDQKNKRSTQQKIITILFIPSVFFLGYWFGRINVSIAYAVTWILISWWCNRYHQAKLSPSQEKEKKPDTVEETNDDDIQNTMNKVLMNMWPYLKHHFADRLKSQSVTKIQDSNVYLSSFKMLNIDLGRKPPHVSKVTFYKRPEKEQIVLDLDIR